MALSNSAFEIYSLLLQDLQIQSLIFDSFSYEISDNTFYNRKAFF